MPMPLSGHLSLFRHAALSWIYKETMPWKCAFGAGIVA